MSHNQLTQHSSHLWISDPVTVQQQVIASLQQALCSNNQCLQCSTCQQIEQKMHPWITWLEPENSYSVDQIDDVINSVQFILDSNEKRFFIFTQAQELTPACCNRLLKTIEEPHFGYHFIFMTTRPEELLATLKSRCFVKKFHQQALHHQYDEILQPFTSLTFKNPIQFMKLIDKHEIKESATKEIIDLLLEHFHKKLQLDESKKKLYLDLMILLKKQLLQLPLPGSTKLFWKNLYLGFHYQIICSTK